MSTRVAQSSAEPMAPVIRLRWVLLLAGALGVVFGLVPRARAAWSMYSIGPAAADYALCMAGPTGPQLFQESPGEFVRLLRRRLVAAGATAKPFSRCQPLAETLGASPRTMEVLGLTAVDFKEWEGSPRAAYTLNDIDLTVEQIRDQHARAWPFLRGDYARLMQPSRLAPAAVHPVAPPMPVLGTGLPDRRSLHLGASVENNRAMVTMATGSGQFSYTSDDGYAWREFPRSRSANAPRCGTPSKNLTAQVGQDGRGGATWVKTFVGESLAFQAEALGPGQEVFGASCDERALLVLGGDEGSKRLVLCPYGARCRTLPLPELAPGLSIESLELEVARAEGATILAVSLGPLVRVASSRDDGQSWTPWSLAFDANELERAARRAEGRAAVPSRLLTVDSKVILYAGYNRPSDRYPVLVSTDFGASFRGARRE